MHRFSLKFKDEVLERKYQYTVINQKKNIILFGCVFLVITGAAIDFGALGLSINDKSVLSRFFLVFLMLVLSYLTFYKDKKFLANYYENEINQL